MRGFWAGLRKEAIQMRRDTGTLRFALAIPVFQLVLFGLIDTNVQHVPTAVFDQSQTADSRELVRDFVNTSYFEVLEFVPSRAALRERIVAGQVSVGIEIPPDYARKRLDNQPADFMVLIDGSDSTVSSATLAATNGLSLQKSLEDIARRTGIRDLPLQPFPMLLFNPDSRSANLLIPGLVAILLTFSGTVLAAFSIVRERERGTLEQLMVTPASPVAVVLGKLLPYLALGFVQLLLVLILMVFVFRVPIHGNVFLLRQHADGGDPGRAGLPAALDHALRLHLSAVLPAGAAAGHLAGASGHALHLDLPRHHHPGSGLPGPVAGRARAAGPGRDPGRRQHPRVPQDH